MRRATPILPERSPEGRILSGVCAGISDAYAFDVTLVRLAFLVLALGWGLGVFLYGALWLFMPDFERGDTPAEGVRDLMRYRARGVRDDLQRTARSLGQGWHRMGRDPWPRPVGRRWMAVAMIALGAIAFLTSLGAFSWITPARAASLALIVAGVAAILSLRTDGG